MLTLAVLLFVSRQAPAAEEPVTFHEDIEVAPLTLEVQVTDADGKAVEGLTPRDFRVRVDRRPVTVQGADWVAPGQPLTAGLTVEELAVAGVAPTPAERLLVVFVQTSFEPSRMRGHLGILPRVSELLAAQADGANRIAIVSFDSHLRLRQDFTTDGEALQDALEQALRLGGEEGQARFEEPSLGLHLDPDEARRAGTPERALELVARALGELSGDRALVYVGYGLGRGSGRGVELFPDYYAARRALTAANIPVYVLDITDADYHTLEVGLEQVAADTGGTYAKTNQFPGLAIRNLDATLAGYYLLTVERPATMRARSRVDVELVGRKGTVRVVVR
jgi:VWFA-related protein